MFFDQLHQKNKAIIRTFMLILKKIFYYHPNLFELLVLYIKNKRKDKLKNQEQGLGQN